MQDLDFKIKGNLRQGFSVVFTDGTITTHFLNYTEAYNYAEKVILESNLNSIGYNCHTLTR